MLQVNRVLLYRTTMASFKYKFINDNVIRFVRDRDDKTYYISTDNLRYDMQIEDIPIHDDPIYKVTVPPPADPNKVNEVLTIRDILAKYNYKQAELARRFGIPIRTIQNWCAGVNKPPAYLIRMMDELLTLQKGLFLWEE